MSDVTQWEFDEQRAMEQEITSLRAELERERMRLAACGVIAMANTPESAARARDIHPDYRSASCDDVARAVDSEMSLRAELTEATKPTCNACANFHSCWSRSWNNPNWARVFCPDGERFDRVDPVRLYEKEGKV